MKAMIVDGVKYHKISSYYAQELLDSEELNSYLDKMLESKKSVYDYVVYDSAIESRFAEENGEKWQSKALRQTAGLVQNQYAAWNIQSWLGGISWGWI